MFRSKVQLLAAGVSVLAINAVAPGGVQAQVNDPGLSQFDADADGANIYVVPNGFHGGWDDTNDPTKAGNVTVDCGQASATPAEGTADPSCAPTTQGEINQFVADTGPVSNLLTNGGVGTVEAATSQTTLVGAATASVFIGTGIEQRADATGVAATDDATNTFTNTGTFNILADADANVTFGTATANAEIGDAGVRQEAYAPDQAINQYNATGAGTLNVTVTADANADSDSNGDGFNADAHANLNGAGLGQVAKDGSLISFPPEYARAADNVVTNGATGGINVTAAAQAIANDGEATATATIEIGVGQLARGIEAATNVITNDGPINVLAEAIATGNTANATATIGNNPSVFNNEGIGQRAYSNDEDGGVSNTLNSTGAIDITANAQARADVGDAEAFASIETGIYHDASGGDLALNTLTNGAGPLTVGATATAVAQNAANTAGAGIAIAVLSSGIEQNATAFGTNDDTGRALSSITNGAGTIDVGANALATGDEFGLAVGFVNHGITQLAEGKTEAAASIANNGGTINVGVGATANGVAQVGGGGGIALALMQTGIRQQASATTVTDGVGAATVGDADASITNTGTINVTADANVTVGTNAAVGATGGGFALAAIGTAIEQEVQAGSDADALIDNDGTVNIAANATATAPNGAGAIASLGGDTIGGYDKVVHQYASDADVTLSNGTGDTFNVHANAVATAVTTNVNPTPTGTTTTISGAAFALASIGTAIAQTASGTLANVDVTNNGLLDIRATGAAKGGSEATGVAFIHQGILQDANANSGTVQVADADITNSGTLNIVADAAASVASEGTAYAFGIIETGIFQDASATGVDGSANASLSNAAAGVIEISAGADATGPLALAYAYIGTGIEQSAIANSEDGSATVALTNDGSLTVAGDAFASASGTAYAFNFIGTGIEQGAFATGSEGEATATLNNGSTLAITGRAEAQSTVDGDAFAFAYLGTGIFQEALATGSDGVAIGTLGNDGNLAITVDAVAGVDGTEPVTAQAYAYAYLGTGIFQVANAGSEGLADLTLTNAGTLTVRAGADADAAGTTGSAYADAVIGIGIGQEAIAGGGSADASAELTNSGTLGVLANANAAAVLGQASAYASIETGIYQLARENGADGEALAQITNSAGTLTIGANAVAAGDDADAYASVQTGIYQEARVNGADGTATGEITNNATLIVSANANAVADATDGSADAYAYIGNGVFQSGRANGDDGEANLNLTNTAALQVTADAFGSAVGSHADVTAHIETGIGQVAEANGTSAEAHIDLTNSTLGVILVSADASALGTRGSASAIIESGILQEAEANDEDGVARIALTNDGAITISGEADVSADAVAGTPFGTSAIANVLIENGIHQDAESTEVDGEATIGLTNSGSVTISGDADAFAIALGASAHVTIEDGIRQDAEAEETGGDASVSLISSGLITISGNAVATGARAEASASIENAIDQEAETDGDDGDAKVLLTNTGAIDISATANAVANLAGAQARAESDVVIEQIADADGTDDGIATVTFNNGPGTDPVADPGTLDIAFSANAAGVTSVSARATADSIFHQEADADGDDGRATAEVDNSGSIDVSMRAIADAVAPGPGPGGIATAVASVDEAVIGQEADANGEGGIARVTLDNTGTINLTGFASAIADFSALATAAIGTGIGQQARGFDDDTLASVRAVNAEGAELTLDVTAKATGAAVGSAFAIIGDGIEQDADGSSATAFVENNGTLTFTADADALAGVFANASASVEGIDQDVDGVTFASASVVNTEALTVAATANARAGNITPFGGDAVAFAWGSAINQEASVFDFTEATSVTPTAPAVGAPVFDVDVETDFPSGPALVTVHNTAAIDVSAVASATAAPGAATAAAGAFGIDQFAEGDPATALVTNDAPLTLLASANADGATAASAQAFGNAIFQGARALSFVETDIEIATGATPPLVAGTPETFIDSTVPFGAASVTVLNTAAIDLTANATAVADGSAVALAGAFFFTTTPTGAAFLTQAGVVGIWQEAEGTEANLLVDNSLTGSITVDAVADASGGAAATAAAIGAGIMQFGSAITVAETDVITFVGRGTVVDDVETLSVTPSGEVDATVVNNNTIALTVSANAVAGTGAAFALVGGPTEGFFDTTTALPAVGVMQFGHGADVSLTVENNASLTVDASATADGGTSAVALASGAGILQLAGAFGWETVATQVPPATTPTISPTTYTADGVVSVSVTNTDTIDVSVAANAVADGFASASANAIGVGQLALGEDWTASLINEGDLLVSAVANATAAAGTAVAHASAVGYGLVASGGVLTVVNTDTIDVTADAGATGTASANAVGISAAGVILGTGLAATPGTINGTITNSGTIDVRALVDTGDDATATGIIVTADAAAATTPTPAAGDPRNLIITNDGGTITAAVSYNGGAVAPATVQWHRGMAIDVSDANVGGTLINLTGAGTIYGNIDLSAVADDAATAGVEGDEIVVSGGETSFDGIINPEWAEPPLGPQPSEAPNPTQPGEDPSPAFGGTLSIVPGGSLFLRDNSAAANAAMYDGPAQAYVSTFNTSGNLVYELQISGPNANAHYPQIFANTANLGGTLEIRRTAVAGPALFDDVYYDNVIEADVRNGRFTNANDVPVWTPPNIFVGAKIIYDENNNVDINIDRTEFDVACANFGGTFNQCSAAGGIENVYSTSLTGAFAGVVANLFTLNQAGYLDALNQLAGAQYASYLQGLRNNSFATNSIVSDQIDCAISIRAVDQCRDRNGTGRFWVMGKYNWADYDGDQEAGAYDLKGWTGMVGADYTFGNFTLGGFVGYRDIDLNFDWYNGDMSATGWQGGLYAGYDVGSFYIRGIGSYSSLDGDSERDLNFATTIGTLNGDPDVNIWSFYGEAGARFDMGSSWLTPFVAVDYTDIKLKSFTETGPAPVVGAALAFDSQHEKQTSTLVGVKWAGNWGGIVPEAKLAWRHDFGDRTFDFDARFAGAPAGSDHRIISSRVDRESIVGGLSLAAAFGSRTTGRIGYQGRFNSDVTDHSVYGSLTFHFGGAPAPAPEPIPTPPAPPPPAEPAPPPAVVAPGPFIVFFDWDKSDITPQAAAILDNAAAAYQQTGSAQVMLAGNADRSGPADYNVGLSQRRADAVRAYLAGRGIPDNVITTEANGENRPIVETADGVREPQNRNVQITYGPGSGQ